MIYQITVTTPVIETHFIEMTETVFAAYSKEGIENLPDHFGLNGDLQMYGSPKLVTLKAFDSVSEAEETYKRQYEICNGDCPIFDFDKALVKL